MRDSPPVSLKPRRRHGDVLRVGGLLRDHARNLALGGVAVLISQSLKLALPWLVRGAVDTLATGRPGAAAQAATLAGIMVVFAVVGNIVRVVSRVVIFDAARTIERDLRFDIYRHLQRLTPDTLQEMGAGELIARMSNDLTNVRVMAGPLYLNVVNTGTTYLLTLPMLLSIDPSLALLSLLPNPLVIFGMALFARAIMSRSRAVQERLGVLSTAAEEDLNGLAVIRLFGNARWRREAFAAHSEEYCRNHLALARVRGALSPLVGMLAGAGMLVVLWFGGQRVIAGDVTLGEFFAFSLYLGFMVWPTLALGWVLSGWQRGQASLHRLQEVFDLAPLVTDGPRHLPPDVRGALRIEGLTLRHGDRCLLDDVHLEVRPGSVVAIVGRTGAGKSVLVRALARLIPIPEGTVFLDGVDTCQVGLAELRAQLAVVPQDTYLFSTTIRENIAIGSPDGELDEALLHDVIATAALEEDLARFPQGVDTVVGERGFTLSGGQRQRVAIARALVRRPPLVVLDDSLSSLDADTERDILARLSQEMSGRSVLVVSHRLSAVQWADRIVVLDEGRVVEEGTHAELTARRGVYHALFEEQSRTERLERAGQSE